MPVDPLSLRPLLVVAPGVPFDAVARALAALGWERDLRGPVTPDARPGEPELAGWRWRGDLPVLTATFHPVLGSRTLDVGDASPARRAEIAAVLPLLDDAAADAAFSDADPRRRLLAIALTRTWERLERAEAVRGLCHDPDPTVREVAAATLAALERAAQAGADARAGLNLLAGMARPLLIGLDVEGALPLLRPTHQDVAALVHPALAGPVWDRVDAMWKDPPTVDPGPEKAELEVAAATGRMLRGPGPESARFPQGWRGVAGWLEPERVWLAWRVHAPGDRGRAVSYDGLAFVNGRWVWCPKLWRVLGEVARERA